ncbi:unnamed protein product [Lathyrus sativus]|nr:unnamed protein product [Lathyrus sativus]
MDMEHVIEDDYMIDELDSGADEDSYDDRPAMIMFNKEETLRNNFTFKAGMKFSSLNKFKKVILEHNVLNGNEACFAKNDGFKCRVVCKDKKHCNYIVLCS